MKKWEKYSEKDLKNIILKCTSINDLARKLGYSENSGSSNIALVEMINKYNFDISHFTGQGWNKDNYDLTSFRKNNAVKSYRITKTLIYLRGHICESCGQSEWNGKPIPLESHHIDGDSLNNELSNLQLLCRNCHALTDSWRKCSDKIVTDEEFIEALKTSPNIRQALIKIGLKPKGANYKRAYKLLSQNENV